MTQDALAAQVPGMSASAISQLENGNSKGVKPENLLHLAQALGVSMHELVTGKPDPHHRLPKIPSNRKVRLGDPQEEKLLATFRKLAPERRALLLTLAVMLAGCATAQTWHWERKGAGPNDAFAEQHQCRAQALSATANTGGLVGVVTAQSIQESCMYGKGWYKAAGAP